MKKEKLFYFNNIIFSIKKKKKLKLKLLFKNFFLKKQKTKNKKILKKKKKMEATALDTATLKTALDKEIEVIQKKNKNYYPLFLNSNNKLKLVV